MPKAKRPRSADAAADPDRLVRQSAGTYRTADDRFEVRNGGTGWFLVDTAQTNDFGQELILGPYPTLAAAGAAVAPARTSPVTPLRPDPPARARPKRGKSAAAPPPPKRTWIDELPKRDANAVRERIAALEQEGIAGAEALVRRDREGIGPEVASRRIEARLEAIVAELPERGRAGARELVQRAAEVLSAEGTTRTKGLPGWTLVELDADGEPPNRRIIIRELPD